MGLALLTAVVGQCKGQQWECSPTCTPHCPTACTSLQPAPAEPRNPPSPSKGCYKAPAEGFGAAVSPTLQMWGGTGAHRAAHPVQGRELSGCCISQEPCNPCACPALLSPSEHPPFPSLTGSWNSASHSRLLWALSLCQAVQQEPR